MYVIDSTNAHWIIVDELIGIIRSTNDGIAFGINIPEPWQTLVIGTAVTIVALIGWSERSSSLHAMAFGLILGGAFGNIIDRLIDGMVTDYIRVGAFPSFNVADSCITIGAGLLLFSLLIRKEKTA
jgi:signal peptidase II